MLSLATKEDLLAHLNACSSEKAIPVLEPKKSMFSIDEETEDMSAASFMFYTSYNKISSQSKILTRIRDKGYVFGAVLLFCLVCLMYVTFVSFLFAILAMLIALGRLFKFVDVEILEDDQDGYSFLTDLFQVVFFLANTFFAFVYDGIFMRRIRSSIQLLSLCFVLSLVSSKLVG